MFVRTLAKISDLMRVLVFHTIGSGFAINIDNIMNNGIKLYADILKIKDLSAQVFRRKYSAKVRC